MNRRSIEITLGITIFFCTGLLLSSFIVIDCFVLAVYVLSASLAIALFNKDKTCCKAIAIVLFPILLILFFPPISIKNKLNKFIAFEKLQSAL